MNGELEGIRKGMAVALLLVRLSEKNEETPPQKKPPNQNSPCRRRNSSTAPPAATQMSYYLNQGCKSFPEIVGVSKQSLAPKGWHRTVPY